MYSYFSEYHWSSKSKWNRLVLYMITCSFGFNINILEFIFTDHWCFRKGSMPEPLDRLIGTTKTLLWTTSMKCHQLVGVLTTKLIVSCDYFFTHLFLFKRYIWMIWSLWIFRHLGDLMLSALSVNLYGGDKVGNSFLEVQPSNYLSMNEENQWSRVVFSYCFFFYKN